MLLSISASIPALFSLSSSVSVTTRASTATRSPFFVIINGFMSISFIKGNFTAISESPLRIDLIRVLSAFFSPLKLSNMDFEESSSIMCSISISCRGAILKTTSFMASVNIPPRPNITTCPNC